MCIRDRVKAGVHYVVLNLLGSSFFLIGVSLLYGLTGTLNMPDLAARVALSLIHIYTRRPFENVLEGYPVDFELMARILVDKYQYGLSLERLSLIHIWLNGFPARRKLNGWMLTVVRSIFPPGV